MWRWIDPPPGTRDPIPAGESGPDQPATMALLLAGDFLLFERRHDPERRIDLRTPRQPRLLTLTDFPRDALALGLDVAMHDPLVRDRAAGRFEPDLDVNLGPQVL